ncbi:MAG: glycosyltransferase family 4 protein [Acidimicrobiales bacterium]|nr:glycosyltransferase family 4 protein [Acidimicrobiales bacterium]
MSWYALGVSFVLALVLTPLVIALLRRAEIYDTPGERSSHSTATPRGGGVAVAIAGLSTLALVWNGAGGPAIAVAVTATGFGFVGLADDLFDLSPNLRLAIQLTFGVISSVLLLNAAGLPTHLMVLAFGATVFWLMSFVNAFNFMDGINGMSVAQACVAGTAWTILGVATGEPFLATAGAIQLGATLGFAPFNVPRARVFLGDVGSYFLGAWMAALAVVGLRAGLTPEAVLAPMALYLIDTGSTLIWRVRSGHEWRQPHRHHVYQRLTDLGWSHSKTAAFAAAIIGLCALLGGLSATASLPARVVADVGLILAVVAYLDWPMVRRGEASTPTGAGVSN